jgi:hypothetical protein
MKKFNGFESHLFEVGIKNVAEQMKQDILKTEEEGNTPLMTTGYVDMVVDEALEKLDNLTIKA